MNRKIDQGYLLQKKTLFNWLDSISNDFNIFGPVLKKKGQVIFEYINNFNELNLDYCSTMTAPRRFIYPSRQLLFKIDRKKNEYQTVLPDEKPFIIIGIHPCDMHAISVLDRTFLGDYKDEYYKKLRESTITVVMNCNKSCDKGFCSSMGTGPHLRIKEGYDIELTDENDLYLVEFGSQRGRELIEKIEDLKKAAKENYEKKTELEKKAIESFKKTINTEGLPELILRNIEHKVYEKTADERCLGCTNCTMVCPTCYCYNMEDHTSYDLKKVKRKRHWDSCQELNFARVHHGNYQSSRTARLRQFVTHKLGTWVEQYGCFGCVGCGRCMTWCPTGIDLTEMAKEVQGEAL